MGLLAGDIMAEECLEVKVHSSKKKKKTSQLILRNGTRNFFLSPCSLPGTWWYQVPQHRRRQHEGWVSQQAPWGVARLLAYFSTLQFPRLYIGDDNRIFLTGP